MLLVVPTINSPVVASVYILLFGIGSILGMSVMSLVMSIPFYLTAKRFRSLNLAIGVLSGAFSIVLGTWVIYENLIA